MSGPYLTRRPSLEGFRIPELARILHGGTNPVLAWRDRLDGLSFCVAEGSLRWNPVSGGVDLRREIAHLR
ncbi:hypothetical protein C5C18_06055 [Rathayibacter tritici]|uniref:Uncharacterized protein n=1 Tax=Rathayibacter tritici TaxID=33888 RepID=A0A160KRN2_9MICO|nr:hypothetical protein [Rathayibacter tritici]AND16300.1 hypothetical protein A6122_1153 [Rathayibacter tritici]PPF68974.1 hypothetical protein C5C21_03640 [Rathayibacter tritici]PPG07691.1 hypothetical protein C5C18_06055 [Rathayibacter tritici]PPI42717.1 hypothetical protein C5D18_12100 [Rathayibacter tritici]